MERALIRSAAMREEDPAEESKILRDGNVRGFWFLLVVRRHARLRPIHECCKYKDSNSRLKEMY